MGHDCPDCDYSSDTYSGLAIHYGKTHGGDLTVAIHGEEKILELYGQMGSGGVAEELGVGKSTAVRAIKEVRGSLRSSKEAGEKRSEEMGAAPDVWNAKAPYLTHHDQGYEEIRHRGNRVYVHRLAAIAWYGYDAVAGHHIHHKNRIPWDNREGNVEPMTASDHRSHHTQEMWEEGYGVAEREQ